MFTLGCPKNSDTGGALGLLGCICMAGYSGNATNGTACFPCQNGFYKAAHANSQCDGKFFDTARHSQNTQGKIVNKCQTIFTNQK